MTSIVDKLNTIGNFNNSINGIEKFNSNYKGINEISVINDRGEGRILKNGVFELANELQENLEKLKKVLELTIIQVTGQKTYRKVYNKVLMLTLFCYNTNI